MHRRDRSGDSPPTLGVFAAIADQNRPFFILSFGDSPHGHSTFCILNFTFQHSDLDCHEQGTGPRLRQRKHHAKCGKCNPAKPSAPPPSPAKQRKRANHRRSVVGIVEAECLARQEQAHKFSRYSRRYDACSTNVPSLFNFVIIIVPRTSTLFRRQLFCMHTTEIKYKCASNK